MPFDIITHEFRISSKFLDGGEEELFFFVVVVGYHFEPGLTIDEKIGYVLGEGDVWGLKIDAIEAPEEGVVCECHFGGYFYGFICELGVVNERA